MGSKNKKNKEITPQEIKALKEAHLKEVAEYKKRMQPLVHFLRKHKLKFSHAQVGNQRVEFFRLDEFQKLVKAQTESIEKDKPLHKLVKNAFDQFIFFKRPEDIKVKYPKTLEPVLQNNPQKKYASFRFDTTQSKRNMTILVIMLVLIAVLFPIWPFSVKYGIWLVSLILLVILVGIIAIRLAVFIICVIFNYHVWIFPNLFETVGIIDSLLPVIEVFKGQRSWFNFFIRMFALSVFMLLCMHVFLNPTFLDDTLQSTKVTISDVHDWGVNKIENKGNFSQRALTNLDEILNQTAHPETVTQGQEHIQNQPQDQSQYNHEPPLHEQKYEEQKVQGQQSSDL